MKKVLIVVFVVFVVFSFLGHAKANEAFVRALAGSIAANYVFEDKGQAMEKMLLENLRAGRYDDLEEGDLAEMLHKDLQTFSGDKHLAVVYESLNRAGAGARRGLKRKIPEYQHGIGTAKEVAPGVGYLEIVGFRPVSEALRSHVKKQMTFLANFEKVIIDLRNNSGGSPGAVQLLCSYFFKADDNIHLNTLEIRNRGFRQDFFVLKEVDGPRLLQQELYLLTSDFTFSAAEEFAYNLQAQQRAVIVGEVTGGGAHPVVPYMFDGGFTAMIPVGRAINPITKTNWEGVGVRPDHEIEEEKALGFVLSKESFND